MRREPPRVLAGLGHVKPVLVPRHEAGPLGLARFAYPDLAIGMQAATPGGWNSRVACPVEQARVGHAAIGMNAAIAGDRLVPGGPALSVRGRIAQCRAIELVLVQIYDNFIAVLDEGDRAAERGFWTDVADDETD